MLVLESLRVSYGDAIALSNVSITAEQRSVTAVIGANGAGKSSLGQAIAGLTKSTGSVLVDAEDVSRLSPESRVGKGIVYVPEGRRVFKQLTVEENLRAGGFSVRRAKSWEERRDSIYDRAPALRARADIKAGLLSGGEQQFLAIGRALMAHPRLLVLDEPSLGLSPMAIQTVGDFLTELMVQEELTVLLLEQNVSFASRLASKAYVLTLGRVMTELDAAEIADPDRARAALMAWN